MKKLLLPLFTIIIAIPVISQTKKAQPTKSTTAKPTTTPVLKTLRDSTSYALGVNIARNLKAQNLDKIDAMLLYKGLSDVLLVELLA